MTVSERAFLRALIATLQARLRALDTPPAASGVDPTRLLSYPWPMFNGSSTALTADDR